MIERDSREREREREKERGNERESKSKSERGGLSGISCPSTPAFLAGETKSKRGEPFKINSDVRYHISILKQPSYSPTLNT